MKYKLRTPSIIRLLAIFSILLFSFLLTEGLKSELSEISEHPKNASLSFQKESCEVEQIGHEIIVYCKLKVLFRESSNGPLEEELYLKEGEIEGSATGDFVAQTISPLSNRPNLYHNPFPLPLKLKNLTDQVMTMINLQRPHQSGRLKWAIPTTIQDELGEVVEEVSVIQEFILEESILTLKKGGLKLIEVDLNNVSHPINNLP